MRRLHRETVSAEFNASRAGPEVMRFSRRVQRTTLACWKTTRARRIQAPTSQKAGNSGRFFVGVGERARGRDGDGSGLACVRGLTGAASDCFGLMKLKTLVGLGSVKGSSKRAMMSRPRR